MAQYWLVSLPVEGNQSAEVERSWRQLKQKTEEEAELCQNYRFTVPELRVGNFDSLLALSDDLVKITGSADAAAGKFRRQVSELERHNPEGSLDVLVEGLPVERYLTTFQWDEAKHPPRRPMKETVDKITESISHLEDDLKVRTSEFSSVKSSLVALSRKAAGSLAIRDLSGLVPEDQITDSENLGTLLVVVPRYQGKEWLACYETLTQYVVPRSSEMVVEEADYCLYTVVLFKRVADAFRHAAREKGFQVRECKHEASSSASTGDEKARLEAEVERQSRALEEWCRTSYSEVFSCLAHLCAIRLFVESVLRYGLPPCFLSAVIIPNKKAEKKLRTLLAAQFGRSQEHWQDDVDEMPTGGDLYPYVSLAINVA